MVEKKVVLVDAILADNFLKGQMTSDGADFFHY